MVSPMPQIPAAAARPSFDECTASAGIWGKGLIVCTPVTSFSYANQGAATAVAAASSCVCCVWCLSCSQWSAQSAAACFVCLSSAGVCCADAGSKAGGGDRQTFGRALQVCVLQQQTIIPEQSQRQCAPSEAVCTRAAAQGPACVWHASAQHKTYSPHKQQKTACAEMHDSSCSDSMHTQSAPTQHVPAQFYAAQ
jgi:hypothetical protein